MKLTTEQIECINETLFSKGLIFEDIKLEVLDHIASDIEVKIDVEKTSFESAFKSVLQKWKNTLQTTSNSMWLGMLFHAPQIAIDKLVSYSKKQVLNVLFLSIVFATSISILSYVVQIELFVTILRSTLVGLFYVMAIITCISLYVIWQSVFKTTFGRLFLYRGWVVFVFCYMTNLESQPLKKLDANHSATENFISCLLYGFLFFYSYCQMTMAFKHFRIISKLKRT
jgi:hypothetical protein